MMINKKGQNIAEYAIIIGVVGSALLFMSVYFQRSIQSIIKGSVDNLGGFGRKDYFSAQRIQELGMEDKTIMVDGQPKVTDPLHSTTSVNSTRTITDSSGGARRLDINEDTNITQTQKAYLRIKYDQIQKRP